MIVYQKEPHAGQMAFVKIGQPKTIEERCELAKRMKSEYEMPMDVLVDSMDDSSRQLLSDLPSPVFVIDKSGTVRAKFPWPNRDQIKQAVAVLASGDEGN